MPGAGTSDTVDGASVPPIENQPPALELIAAKAAELKSITSGFGFFAHDLI